MFFTEFGNSFKIFSIQHIIPIILIIILIFFIIIFKNQLKKYLTFIKAIIIILIFLLYLLYYIWLIIHNLFDYKDDLPLELCDLMVLLIIPLFITKNRYLFEILYFIGIGGSLYALITPALYYGFPHYLYFFFFIYHSLTIIAPLIMIIFYNFKISFYSLIRAFLALNFIGIIVYIIDITINANYMFLREKPYSITLFNFMGDWPIYLFTAEILALLTFFILYLSFFIYKKLKIRST